MSDTLKLVVDAPYSQLQSQRICGPVLSAIVPPMIFPMLHYLAEGSLVLTELNAGCVDDKLKRIDIC